MIIIANRVPSRVTPAGILWETRYNGPANEFDRPSNVDIAPSGDVIVCGPGVVLKYDGVTGKLRWQNSAGVQVLVVDAHGDLYAAGSEDNGYKKGVHCGNKGFKAIQRAPTSLIRWIWIVKGMSLLPAILLTVSGHKVLSHSTGHGPLLNRFALWGSQGAARPPRPTPGRSGVGVRASFCQRISMPPPGQPSFIAG